jgi:hypothetical protein
MPTHATFDNKFGLSPQETTNARNIILAWLECGECTDADLQAVIKLGPVAVPTLAAVLKYGPSPERLQRIRQKLSEDYANTQQYLKDRPESSALKLSNAQYVERGVRNVVTKYKVGAAIALGKIGGNDARNALNAALAGEKSNTITKTIKEALANLH